MKISKIINKIKHFKGFNLNVDKKLKSLDKTRRLVTNIFIILVVFFISVLVVFMSSNPSR